MPYRLDSHDVHISASIGIALYPADGANADTLTQHADVAMYSAKTQGRRRIQFYSEDLQASLDRRGEVEEEIWNALEEDRYFLLYQPQVDLATGRITGAEALLRLRRKDGGIMPPAEFMALAENSELIVEIGDWVVRKACTELSLLHEIAPELTMSVNLSARQFRDIDVNALLKDVLSSCRVDARSLDLEITESALLADPAGASAKLDELRDVAGVRLSLDDFGTGYSSLTYVRMFHANTVKIDRSFVALLPDDPEAQAVVRSIIALARELNATVIAEGPETEEQVRFLRANGCDSAQGFFFSRPIPADDLADLLRKGPFDLPDAGAGASGRRKKAGTRS
jgi:EAL domain-containing protein (putative c-di-GMP-specific phosphodiesterase class I)